MSGRRKRKINPPQTQLEKIAILSNAPPGTERFRVTDVSGATKWRSADQVLDTDFLNVKDGTKDVPVIMMGVPGKKREGGNSLEDRARERSEKIKRDPLVLITHAQPDSPQVLDQVMRGLASECAAMELERERLEVRGEKTINASARRVQALKAIGDTFLKRKDQATKNIIDLDSPVFKSLLTFLMENFHGALKDSKLRPETVSTVMTKLSEKMGDDWAPEARRRMKNAGL